jgi:UDP-N-acetylmuramyl tripeptide synthase
MELLDSRRLTGANILWDQPGAVIDVAVLNAERDELIEVWTRTVRRRLDAVGWSKERSCVRVFDGGASLAISAPLDALYAATEVNESAWRAAHMHILGDGGSEDFEDEVTRLRAEIVAESNPPLLALRVAAHEHGVQFLTDDDCVSVGLGTGSQHWPVGGLPGPEQVDWQALHDVPTAMVTGTNGKTTTVRLLASIASAAGRCAGTTSTDGVYVDSEVVSEGDWSGPGGARLVLRDPRVEVSLLETARGGLMRRGLALEHCDVAAVLNVGADHLGEWGVGTIHSLAESKFIVTRVADSVVLNADDPVVVTCARELDKPLVWFSLDPAQPVLASHLAQGGRATYLDADALWLCHGPERHRVSGLDEIPITLGGAARYNVANSLAAVAVAERLGFSLEAIRTGLRSFGEDRAANPGRLNRYELGGVQALVDFAHNPHGYAALFETVRELPAQRRLVLLGQAGDRDEESIRELARITWDARPDMIVIKELTEHLRGREPGAIPALIESELRAVGVPSDRFVHCASELEAVDWARAWSRPGDLLVLLAHDSRDEVLSLLGDLERDAALNRPDPSCP